MRNWMVALALLFLAGPALAGTTPVSPSAETHFVNVKDGDTVTSPFKVVFGSTNIAIAPAGAVAPGSGHYHLLIDTALTPDEQAAAFTFRQGADRDDGDVATRQAHAADRHRRRQA